jgi:hypothetical protein
MTLNEAVSAFLKFVELATQWPVLLFVGITLAHKNLLKIVDKLIMRLNKAPGGWEFEPINELRSEIASLANQAEIAKEASLPAQKIDPNSISLRHTSEKIDAKYWRVRVWLDAPSDFMLEVQKVVYERHSTFRNRYNEVKASPFEDSFRCWGEFTIRAAIYLSNGQILKRQRYLTLQIEQTDSDA